MLDNIFNKKESPFVGIMGGGPGGILGIIRGAGAATVDPVGIDTHFKSLRRLTTSAEVDNHYIAEFDSELSIGEFISGEVVFDVPGTYTWTVPSGVSKISVVTVAGGGAGQGYSAGAGGGALAYANDISVTAGQSITVEVGYGGQNGPNPGSSPWVEQSGGNSSVSTPGGYVARAGGGAGATRIGSPPPNDLNGTGGSGGTVLVGSGGAGGAGGNMPGRNVSAGAYSMAGGGGAGGYAGNGGAGGDAGSGYANSGSAGSGGAGGGGAGSVDPRPNYGDTKAGSGGGVGLYGQGPNGSGGPNAYTTMPSNPPGSYFSPDDTLSGGGGGSGGTKGGGRFSGDGAGLYGGGGKGAYVGGGAGAVRIIWPGNTRTFPSTSVSKGSNDTSHTNVNDYLIMGKFQGIGGRIFTGLNGALSTDEYTNWGGGNNSNTQANNNRNWFYNLGRRPLREGRFGYNKITSGFDLNKSQVVHFFKEGAGFFNMFSYTGNGNNSRDITHGLSTKPGFIIILPYTESSYSQWRSYDAENSNESFGSFSRSIMNDTTVYDLTLGYISASDDTTFTVTNGSASSNSTKNVNKNGNRYDVIAFENSTICKTGYYTGTGSDQTISTGFDNGIQFFMYKRLNSDANPGGEWTYITGDLKTSGDNYGELFRTGDTQETKNMIQSSGSNLTLKGNGSTIDYNTSGGQYVFLAVAAAS